MAVKVQPPSAGSGGLAATAVKTANYTAVVGDLVPVDTTGGSVTVTLPAAPADKAQIAVKLIAVTGANTVAIQRGGSDVFNKTGGSTSLTLSILNQAAVLQYKASSGVWYVVSTDVPLGALDTRYQPRVVLAGNLGAAYTLDLAGDKKVWLTGTLNANTTITLTGLSAGAEAKLVLIQDATGGRSVAISDGTTPVTVAAPTDPNLPIEIEAQSLDGTELFVSLLGGSAAPAGPAGGDLGGTYPNPLIGDQKVTARKAADFVRAGGFLPASVICSTHPDREVASSQNVPANGTLIVTTGNRFVIPGGRPVSAITFAVGATGASGLSHLFYCLLDKSGNVLATTIDDPVVNPANTSWTANTNRTLLLATTIGGSSPGGTYTPANDLEVYAGIVMSATALPALTASAGPSSAGLSAMTPFLGATSSTGLTGPSSLPSPVGAFVSQGKRPYAHLS